MLPLELLLLRRDGMLAPHNVLRSSLPTASISSLLFSLAPSAQYEVVEGFGWTNGVSLLLLERYGWPAEGAGG